MFNFMEILVIAFLMLSLLGSVTALLIFLVNGRPAANNLVFLLAEIGAMIVLPFVFIRMNGNKNNCCDDSALFSPDHAFSIIALIVVCLVAYFYSSYRKQVAPPLTELTINVLLVTAIILNIFIGIQVNDMGIVIVGNVPIIIFYSLALAKNHRLITTAIRQSCTEQNQALAAIAWKILNLPPFFKFPLLLFLCLPLLVLIAGVLLLFGQKPDSMIRAFTDTYKHGFSQLNHECDNVQCGGHFLCSVAANGHTKLVKPLRAGIRHGGNITCNRQLLVANAFEDLLQQNMPSFHRLVRQKYDKVGDIIHANGSIFSNRMVADTIYVLMKPAEWLFLLVLYACDRNPENRIEMQYISNEHRRKLEQAIRII